MNNGEVSKKYSEINRNTHDNIKSVPLCVYLIPSRDQRANTDSWATLEHASKAPLPDVPLDLCLRITGKPPHELSRATLCVIDCLLTGDLLRLWSEEVADTLHVRPTMLRRRLRADDTTYQTILNHVRRQGCTLTLEKRWLPGKCVA